MGYVKVYRRDKWGQTSEVLFDSRVEDLSSEVQLKKIQDLDEIIKVTRNDRQKQDAIRDREILLQAWTGWPRPQLLDDKDYEVKRFDRDDY